MKIVYDSEADKRHRMIVDGDGGRLNVVAFKLEMLFEDGSIVNMDRPKGGFTMKSSKQIIIGWKREFPEPESPATDPQAESPSP